MAHLYGRPDGLDAGCRIDELLDAPIAAVALENLLLTVTGKGDKVRKVPSFELRKVPFRYLQQRARIKPLAMLCGD